MNATTSQRPRVLDLFCGAGSAATGLLELANPTHTAEPFDKDVPA